MQQIGKPDEFDCMLTCTIRAKPFYDIDDIPTKSYCALKILNPENWEPKTLLNKRGGQDSFVCPKAFMDLFRQQVTNLARRLYRTSVGWYYKIGAKQY